MSEHAFRSRRATTASACFAMREQQLERVGHMVSKTRWLDYCLAKPGAWQDEPWDGDVVAKVGDKIFAFLGSAEDQRSIGLKCGDRETADLLLDRYQGAASKMPYIGQHGWNTFTLDGTIPSDEIRDLIDASYDLIVAKLPKSKRPA